MTTDTDEPKKKRGIVRRFFRFLGKLLLVAIILAFAAALLFSDQPIGSEISDLLWSGISMAFSSPQNFLFTALVVFLVLYLFHKR